MNSTTAQKPNLFAAAKKTETKKSSETKKLEVVVAEADHPGFSDKLKKLADLKQVYAEAETEIKTLEQDVKQEGVQAFIKLYEERKVRPESFYIIGEKGGKFLVIVMDKYNLIPDDARAEEIRKAFGEEVVYTLREYKFDNAMLDKYMDALSEAIMNCKAIPDEDKAKLFTLTEKHAIAKGSIERYMQYDEEKRGEFLFNICPQVQLKNAR